ncbi:MAG: DUF853 family protein, partial [Clostridia bacterium]|nr:DUF853 family protein [Clostridia bacterium]
CVFWDVYGEKGHPVRTTVSEMGPLLLSRLLGLNEVQSGVMYLIFRIADQEGLLLIDLKDLKAVLSYVGENAYQDTLEYGNITKATVGAIQRQIAILEDQGGSLFFGEPALDIADFFAQDGDGRGVINVLQAQKLYLNPVMYSTYLLWMLGAIYDYLPETGDQKLPRLVFFFDEAHLLFKDCSKALMDRLEQTVKLIRSKGVGVYFITQSPMDVPSGVLSQLNQRVQHALRAYTPAEIKIVKAASETFRQNPAFKTEDAITELKTGEALISFLDRDGAPCPVQKAIVLPPQSRIGTLTEDERLALAANDAVGAKYDVSFDRESAYEVLARNLLAAENEYGVLEPITDEAPLQTIVPAQEPAPVKTFSFKVFDPVTGAYVEKVVSSAPAFVPQTAVEPAVYTRQTAEPTVYPRQTAYPVSSTAYRTPMRQTVAPKTTVRKTTKTKSTANALDAFTRSAINSAGRTLGSQLTRGLLETLGLSGKKRR